MQLTDLIVTALCGGPPEEEQPQPQPQPQPEPSPSPSPYKPSEELHSMIEAGASNGAVESPPARTQARMISQELKKKPTAISL